jgi:hypothetical protein
MTKEEKEFEQFKKEHKDFFGKYEEFIKLKGQRCFNCFKLLKRIDKYTYKFDCDCIKTCPELKNIVISIG